MSDLSALTAAIDDVLGSDASSAGDVCALAGDALPADGTAMTVMASDPARETIFASDEVIAGFEDAQYDLGAGPSLTAFTTGRPVLLTDVSASSVAARWPALAGPLADLAIGAAFIFPMRFGAIDVGVCSVYRREPGALGREQVTHALDVVDLVTLALLELRERSGGESLLAAWMAVDGDGRRQVHQATGVVVAQLGVSAESAFARLRAHAFVQDTDLETVAARVVSGDLRLEPDPP